MMNNITKSRAQTGLGLFMLLAGLYLVKTCADPYGFLRALPYVLIGLGCGIFGHGMGEIIRQKALKNNYEVQKQIEIESRDERNITIANYSKAKAYDMMIFVFGALMISFALMGIDMMAVLLLVCSYLFVVFYGIYCRVKLEKKM